MPRNSGFDGGIILGGKSTRCNFGVGHFHEVAWSPYHLSQKASYMKYETQQLGNTGIFQQPPLLVNQQPNRAWTDWGIRCYLINSEIKVVQPLYNQSIDHKARYPDDVLATSQKRRPNLWWENVSVVTRGNSLLSLTLRPQHSNTWASPPQTKKVIMQWFEKHSDL